MRESCSGDTCLIQTKNVKRAYLWFQAGPELGGDRVTMPSLFQVEMSKTSCNRCRRAQAVSNLSGFVLVCIVAKEGEPGQRSSPFPGVPRMDNI